MNCQTAEAWRGCYRGAYDIVTAESMAHPAKMSVGLCYRIFEHLAEMGFLGPDTVILDCMAGTGLTGLVAASLGHPAVLVELEPRFVGFIRENKATLEKKLGHPIDLTIIQGDSRKLASLLTERGLCTVVSPPYKTEAEGSLDNTRQGLSRNGMPRGGRFAAEIYGASPGQVGNLPDRVIITSPPYANRVDDHGKDQPGYEGQSEKLGRYGTETGQVGNLRDAVTITSPPYGDIAAQFRNKGSKIEGFEYGAEGANIGNLPDAADPGSAVSSEWWRNKAAEGTQESYLDAMRQIYQQCLLVSDVIAVVVKDPTRHGALRELGKDTMALLEATGWRIHCVHKAVLFETTEQGDLFGGVKKKHSGRVSFFKRLSMEKGNVAANFEWVIIAVNPKGRHGMVTVSSPPYSDAEGHCGRPRCILG